jgi:5-formyltetrahydrofolate cyclo-ligase
MVTDGFGVSVPVKDDLVTPEVLVVPLLAFDDRGHRLGYGAGHYDRTLQGLRARGQVMAIGFAYSAQRTDDPLPDEPTDQPLDAIVTEIGVVRPE